MKKSKEAKKKVWCKNFLSRHISMSFAYKSSSGCRSTVPMGYCFSFYIPSPCATLESYRASEVLSHREDFKLLSLNFYKYSCVLLLCLQADLLATRVGGNQISSLRALLSGTVVIPSSSEKKGFSLGLVRKKRQR